MDCIILQYIYSLKTCTGKSIANANEWVFTFQSIRCICVLIQRCIQNRFSRLSEKSPMSEARPSTVKHLCIAQCNYQDIQFHGSLRWLHLQETPSQNFIKRLKQRRLGADFAWTGRVFRYLTWSGLVVFVLDSLNQIKENVSYKSWIKVVYIVLYVSKHRKCNLTIVIVFCFALSKRWE